MPLDDPIKALEWMVPKLLKDLTEAKILPIKMANLKHQQKLRHFDIDDILYIYNIYVFFHRFRIALWDVNTLPIYTSNLSVISEANP